MPVTRSQIESNNTFKQQRQLGQANCLKDQNKTTSSINFRVVLLANWLLHNVQICRFPPVDRYHYF